MLEACHGESSGEERVRGLAPQDQGVCQAAGPHRARRRPGGRQAGDRARRVPRAAGKARAGCPRPAGSVLARGGSRGSRTGARRLTLVVDASAAVEYLLLTALGERAGGGLERAALAAPELPDAVALPALRRAADRSPTASSAASTFLESPPWSPERPCAR